MVYLRMPSTSWLITTMTVLVGSKWGACMSVGRYCHAVVPLGNLGAALFVAGGYVWVRNDEAIVKTTSVELVLL